MVLQTPLHASVDSSALDLGDLHLEGSLEVAGGDEGDGGGRVPGPGVNVHVVAGVAATDDRHRGSACHHEPGADLEVSRGRRRGRTEGPTCPRCTGECPGQAGSAPSLQSPVCAGKLQSTLSR